MQSHRIFPFNITIGALAILFLGLILLLASRRQLIPGVIILGSFILFVLFLTGLIETSIQLYGSGNVNGNCQQFVTNEEFKGISVETLAWLEQNNICEWNQRLARTMWQRRLTSMYRQLLESDVRIPGCRDGMVPLVDSHGMAGQSGRVRLIVLEACVAGLVIGHRRRFNGTYLAWRRTREW